MADLEPITRDEMLWSGEDVEPITRREMYIKHLYDETQVIPDKPITREEMFILKAGEELHDVTIEQLNVTENGTYSEAGKAYSPVIVEVPETTLTTLDVTENGTYTAPSGTAYDEVDVNVPLPENAYLLKDIEGTPSDIATFTDGSALPMPKLEVAVEPQQDLHGYDAPWVGGAGKNKLPLVLADIKSVNTTGTWNGDVYTINDVTFTVMTDNDGNVTGIKVNGTASDTTWFGIGFTLNAGSYAVNGCPSNGSTSSYLLTVRLTAIGGTSYADDSGNGATLTLDSNRSLYADIRIVSGYTANNLMFYPMIRLASVTDATFAPYSNECPIIGWSAVDVSVMGKNILENSAVSSTSSGVTYTVNSDTTISCSGTATATSYLTIAQNYSLKAGTYILNGCPVDGGMETMRMSLTRPGANVVFDTGSGAEFTLDSDVNDLTLNIRIGSGQNVSGKVFKPMIRLASETDATFEPYNPNSETITIQLGDTYYGGKLDVVSGVLTVTHEVVDLGSLTWSRGNTGVTGRYRFITQSLRSTAVATPSNVVADLKASIFIAVKGDTGWASDVDNVIWCDNYKDISVVDKSYTDATEFKTAMNGVQLVYELATPTTIQLSPTQVNSLLGSNNIWADCGKITDGQYFGKGE